MFSLQRSTTANMRLQLPTPDTAIVITVFDHGTFSSTKAPFMMYYTGAFSYLAATSAFTGALNDTITSFGVQSNATLPPEVVRTYEMHPWGNGSTVVAAHNALDVSNNDRNFYFLVRRAGAGRREGRGVAWG